MEKGEKSEIILEYLRNGIKAGKWDNSLLPKELELAEKFGVARGTVRRAFDHLVNDGVVIRRKHTGTVICRKDNPQKCICSIMRSSGHFYGEIFRSLQNVLSENSYRLHSVDVYGYDKPKLRKSIRRSVNSLLAIPEVDKFILDGYFFKSFPMAEEILKRKPVFFDYFDSSRPNGLTGVMIDYTEVGRLGAKYLLENGCKHPLLIIGDGPTVIQRYNPQGFSQHKSKKIINGFSEILRENGMDPDLYIFFAPLRKKYLFEHLYEIFSWPPSCPDGIFADSDVGMAQVLRIAGECGYNPKYTIGCYDTPWSKGESGFYFKSIIIPPAECAKALFAQVNLPLELRKDVYIKPLL